MNFYGEGGIDKFIRTTFFPLIDCKGFFVEVGAAGPSFLSISKHFRDSGWNVISIEPNPYFAKLHREAGNNILEYACGEIDEDNIEFEMVRPKIEGSSGPITYESFSAIKVKESYRQNDPELFARMEIEKISVNMRHLDTLLLEAGIALIDILTVDVEGWELEVLSGLNFNLYSPRVMVVENWLEDDQYVKKIVDYGYRFVCRIFPNDVYAKQGNS
ncbi:MAG: FkbM family methyltransferase [Proteobacteria bacterium]|nr:FkbM family methyltransferase [Pseudomonadota bacterium]